MTVREKNRNQIIFNLFPVKLLNYFIKSDFIIELDPEKDNDKIKQIHSL